MVEGSGTAGTSGGVIIIGGRIGVTIGIIGSDGFAGPMKQHTTLKFGFGCRSNVHIMSQCNWYSIGVWIGPWVIP